METKVRLRKRRFSDRELCVLVEETLKAQRKLNRQLPCRVRNKAWHKILRRVNSVATSKRTMIEVKKRWYDVKRQRGRDIEKVHQQIKMRLAARRAEHGERGSEGGGGLFNTDLVNFIKEEPEEPEELELQPDPQTDRKLNGQLLPCVPVIKLEDIASHISGTPLYSTIDLESLPDCSSPQLDCGTSPAPDALPSSHTNEIPNVGSPQSSHNSELEDPPSPYAVLAAISAEMKQMTAVCSAMLASSTQILSAVEGLTKVIDGMNYQRRYFHQRMLASMETIAIMLEKRDGC